MIGWMAYSLAGHDKNKIYYIIEETDDMVLLADGECRKIEKPKRKKKKHVQVIKKSMDENLSQKLRAGNANNVYNINIVCLNEEIKRAIKLYKQSLQEKEL